MTCFGMSVGVIVRHADRLLLIQRASGPQRGTWACPAGHWEASELPVDTAAREVREEVGIHLRRDRLGDPVFVERGLEDRCSRGTPRHDWWVFEAWVPSLEFKRAEDETLGARWVPLGEMAAVELEPVWRLMLGRLGHIKGLPAHRARG